MYSSGDYGERPRLSNRGYYSDLTDHRSMYRRSREYGNVEEESYDPDLEYFNDAEFTHSQGVRPRSFGRADIINRVEYRRAQQRPRSFGRIDRIEREDLELPGDVKARVRRTKSDIFDRQQEEEDQSSDRPDSAMHRSSMENLAAVSSPSNVRSFKDQETMIQEIKKENFDLKLRLYMEQKERERLNEEFQQKVVVLETDLTESLDELSDALEREKDYEISLNNARRREKSLMTKLRRLEETMREQDEEIKYLVETRSTYDLSQGPSLDVSTQTDRPGYYEERGIDIGISKGIDPRNSSRNLSKGSDIRNSSRSRTSGDETDVGKRPEKQPPEGVDLLNSASIARKEEILGEARRRRTLKSKKDKEKKKEKALDEMPEVDQTQKTKNKKKKKGFFKNFLCCGSSKTVESDVYERNEMTRV